MLQLNPRIYIFCRYNIDELYVRLPICRENILNLHPDDRPNTKCVKKSFSSKSTNTMSTLKRSSSCRLVNYTVERIVRCLDVLSCSQLNNVKLDEDNTSNVASSKRKMLHFAFVGDSIIRQQFTSFLKVTNGTESNAAFNSN